MNKHLALSIGLAVLCLLVGGVAGYLVGLRSSSRYELIVRDDALIKFDKQLGRTSVYGTDHLWRSLDIPHFDPFAPYQRLPATNRLPPNVSRF